MIIYLYRKLITNFINFPYKVKKLRNELKNAQFYPSLIGCKREKSLKFEFVLQFSDLPAKIKNKNH